MPNETSGEDQRSFPDNIRSLMDTHLVCLRKSRLAERGWRIDGASGQLSVSADEPVARPGEGRGAPPRR